ncbi:MAG: hypothetical protein WDN29_15500 [Methylovirgula sp.]
MRVQAGLLSIVFAVSLAGASFADPLKYDTDKDGTLDLAEMEAAAARHSIGSIRIRTRLWNIKKPKAA